MLRKVFKTFCAGNGVRVVAAFALLANGGHPSIAQSREFSADAGSVRVSNIEPSYCASIDGVDYSSTQYFSGPDQVRAIAGVSVAARSAEGVCCTAAKVLSGGSCVDPVPTAASCAALGMILVAGKCQVAAPEPCPTNEDWFAGRFTNLGELQSPYGINSPQQLYLGASTSGTGFARIHNFERPPFGSGGHDVWESIFNFSVPNVASVAEFSLIQTAVDDHMLIEVNGRAVAALPAAIWMGAGAPNNFPQGATGLVFVGMGATRPENGSQTYGATLLRSSEVSPYAYLGFGLLADNVDMWTHPFIGVPTYERVASAPYKNFLFGGYFPIDNGWGPQWYRAFPPKDTIGGWGESHNIDIRPYLVNGNNKIRFTRLSNGSTYSKAVIRAAAKSTAACN